jgi:hypothetical protein
MNMKKTRFPGKGYTVLALVFALTFAGICFAQTEEAPQPAEAPPAMENQGGAPPAGAPPAGGGPAWMSDTDNMPHAFIKAEDGDGDGKVSKEEFGGPDTLFDEWDKNQDGFIELSEGPTPDMMQNMGAPGGAPPGDMPAGGFVSNSPHVGDGPTGQAFIDMLDTDKDGKVTHEEWEMNKINSIYKEKRWPHYNQNGDDYITLDEAPQEGVNWEEGPVEEKITTPNTNQIAFIAKFDTNQDGKVDNTEFTGVHFPVYDVNSDGFIEPMEAPEGETAY